MSLAPYASLAAKSRGRAVAEADARLRTPFQRDRDRIVHSVAFRRLQYKTQVFVNHEGDHFRTRLTHSLEVAQVARTLAVALKVDSDLTEALALAHDLGHPPFGHAGEDGLSAAMQPWGGFSHNEQTLRVLTLLENRYPQFTGLNLTWETLEGTVKHSGPLQAPYAPTVQALDKALSLQLDRWPSLEAQLAGLADDIAYCTHDIDDGLRAGMLEQDDLAAQPLIGEALRDCRRAFPDARRAQHVYAALRQLMQRLVTDVLETTRANLDRLQPDNSDAIRCAGMPVAAFSPETHTALKQLKAWLMQCVYRHWQVNRMSLRARTITGNLFTVFLNNPDCLPQEWQPSALDNEKDMLARRIGDYIAGMTDRYALQEHQRLFGR